MATKRKRATRSPHPGVVLLAPKPPRTSWRARWADPDSGKLAFARLDPLTAGRSKETRTSWAKAKALEIARRKDALAQGAPKAVAVPLADAFDRFFRDHKHLRPRTLEIYRDAARRFTEWASLARLKTVDDLTPARLVAFRTAIASSPKRTPKGGGGRGRTIATGERRSPVSANINIRSLKTILTHLRRLGLLAHLTSDGITDGLRAFRIERDVGQFLKPPEIAALLAVVEKHDAECFRETRAEHASREGIGSTPRWAAIEPILRVALLTGMRRGELLSLDWVDVELGRADDPASAATGQIIVRAAKTKTGIGRVVSLEESPSVIAALRALGPRGSGSVFELSRDQLKRAEERLRKLGAPKWSWNTLRRSCGTYLTCSPGIYGAASAFHSARRLGHSVAVAERHYLGLVRIPASAKTLEQAMGLASLDEAGAAPPPAPPPPA